MPRSLVWQIMNQVSDDRDHPLAVEFAAFVNDRAFPCVGDKDQWLGQRADPRVAHDPDDPHFAMSFGGEAFFVVGLHPRSSRPARQFEKPAMVFNLHDQFERLRAEGRYDKMRGTILDRDERLAGSVNPMLAKHGTISAARQYSGRAVSDGWECPFSGRSDAQDAA